jgi:hypothetical protein
MSYRIVRELSWAQACPRPDFIPKSRVRGKGSKAAGHRYEAAFAKQIPHALHNPWYRYQDAAGAGWCSPDFVLPLGNWLVVFETKLGNFSEALSQINELYIPVLHVAHGLPAGGIIVLKNLSPEIPRSFVTTSMSDAVARASMGHTPVLHWLGHASLALFGSIEH